MIIREKEKMQKSSLIIIGILLLLFFFRGAFLYLTGNLSMYFFPVQKVIYEGGVFIKETVRSILNYKEILKENGELRAENAKVAMLAEFNKNLAEENERLKMLLEMKMQDNVMFKVARVNFRSPNNLYERFYIDLGEENGIRKDMIVFADRSVIGKIREVFKDYALVDMITGEKYSVSVRTERGSLGMLRGSDEENGNLYFEPNTFQDAIEMGEKVYTSGISDIYPKGLYVGAISEINENENEIFRSIRVKSDVNLINLNEVLILVPEEKKEAEVHESENDTAAKPGKKPNEPKKNGKKPVR
ncbi:MAG: rod shape-determining protein MreC [Fusobacteriaceae bacterium]|jgi:rod shape-determining protein MreC|nr:rod shape-determining protein MreC [Fusobacteriaceae bacterium]